MYRDSDFSDDSAFRKAVDAFLDALLEQVDDIDSDEHEARLIPGNMSIVFEGGGTFVLSQQTPVRELWLSANHTAWHFVRIDGIWVERDRNEPMLPLLSRLVAEKVGLPVSFEV